jgi:hypothetical protein
LIDRAAYQAFDCRPTCSRTCQGNSSHAVQELRHDFEVIKRGDTLWRLHRRNVEREAMLVAATIGHVVGESNASGHDAISRRGRIEYGAVLMVHLCREQPSVFVEGRLEVTLEHVDQGVVGGGRWVQLLL